MSRAAGEPLAATATTADHWLLVEVPGSWPRDVSTAGTLPGPAHAAVSAWLERTPRSRLLFVRRPGRVGAHAIVHAVRAQERTTETRRLEVAGLDGLAAVDFDADGDVVETQLVLVCGHGSRDACCALRGTAIYAALADTIGDDELWISSHQGGHRFAGNVLVLPHGIQLGRLDPGDAPFVTARALAGQIELGHYRGRTCYRSAVQAAEHAVRTALGLDRIEDVQLAGDEGSLVRLRTGDGSEHAVRVEEAVGPVVPASCGADPVAQAVLSARLV
ncbi:MAG: sucrase ferredoxin [Gaiellaceae bacterium]